MESYTHLRSIERFKKAMIIFIVERNSTNEPSVISDYLSRKRDTHEIINYKFMLDPKKLTKGLPTFNYTKNAMTHEMRSLLDYKQIHIDEHFFTTEKRSWNEEKVLTETYKQLRNWCRVPLKDKVSFDSTPEFTFNGKASGADDIAMTLMLCNYYKRREHDIPLSL
jgi:hypothetical protein